VRAQSQSVLRLTGLDRLRPAQCMANIDLDRGPLPDATVLLHKVRSKPHWPMPEWRLQ
jgi:hypothetical protein